MNPLDDLLQRNRAWASARKSEDAEFFRRLAQQQRPRWLWIGCSDSRVPANQIVGMDPGTIFVHRNVANVVAHSDLNCLSVLQFAVDVLEVEHVIVCGHYGCGGVQAALEGSRHGLVDNWLRHVRDVYQAHRDAFDEDEPVEARLRRLSELNVRQQVANVCSTTIVQDSWLRRGGPTVHGLIYDVADGLLQDLDISITDLEEFARLEGSEPG